MIRFELRGSRSKPALIDHPRYAPGAGPLYTEEESTAPQAAVEEA